MSMGVRRLNIASSAKPLEGEAVSGANVEPRGAKRLKANTAHIAHKFNIQNTRKPEWPNLSIHQ